MNIEIEPGTETTASNCLPFNIELTLAYFNEYSNSIVALATVCAAIFAWLAWRTAREDVRQTKQMSIFGLQPYLSIKFRNAIVDDGQRDSGVAGISITISVNNSGKTPAEMICIEFDPESSKLIYRRTSESKERSIADLRPLKNIRVVIRSIAANSFFDVDLVGDWTTNNPDLIKDISNPSQLVRNVWLLEAANLNQFNIRYKDLECVGSDWHKIAIGRISVNDVYDEENYRSTRIYGTDKCKDDSHDYYKNYSSWQAKNRRS